MILNWKFICIAVIAILCVFWQEGQAIKCWKCRSEHDPKCADPFDNSTFAIVDCDLATLEFLPDAKAHMCRKIRQKVDGVWKYIRSCAFLGEPGIAGDERFCLLRTGTYNIFMEYCTCNSKDGCNTSTTLQKSTLLTLVSIVLPFLVFKCMH